MNPYTRAPQTDQTNPSKRRRVIDLLDSSREGEGRSAGTLPGLSDGHDGSDGERDQGLDDGHFGGGDDDDGGNKGVQRSGKSKRKANAPIYGNYKGYYTKRGQTNGEVDERLRSIPKEWIQGKRVLDLGCNSGKVTVDIAQRFEPLEVTGVDIDGELISLAWSHCRLAWSLQKPDASYGDTTNEAPVEERESHPRDEMSVPSASKKGKKKRKRKAAGEEATKTSAKVDSDHLSFERFNYFPLSLPRMFGYLSFPPEDEGYSDQSSFEEGTRRRFPNNITFREADWVNERGKKNEEYDVILALSITKWIHIHNLDPGLLRFFKKVHRTLSPGGRFIVEPQPWSSYSQARRMSKELKENKEKLRLRPDDFDRILKEDVGFVMGELVSQVGEGGFKRDIWVYKKGEE